jgi:diguanylate cyclase (GGDEF)-like protein
MDRNPDTLCDRMFQKTELDAKKDLSNRVLLIDDSADMHKLIAHWLTSAKIDLLHAFGGEDGIRLAEIHKPTLILLDYMMPDCDGLAVLERLKANADLRDIPVIMITANNDRTLISQAFEKGVCDYVNKPLYSNEFCARINMVLKNRALLADLTHKSHYDSLTGLPNKVSLQERLQTALERSRKSAELVGVMFIDLDRFKLINDSLGHAFGDVMLQQAAQRLRTNLRRTDTLARCDGHSLVARLGGDEFVVLLESIKTRSDATIVAQRILNSLLEPYVVEGRTLYLGASIGIVTCCGDYNSTGDVIRDADIAMYEAKEAGRSCFKIFDAGMRDRAQMRWKLDIDLRSAIELNQLYLDYQPILDLQTGEVHSVEALIRWQHPERGLISPTYFIPLAEELGLMIEIGQWVMRSACSQFADWARRDPETAPKRISVNLARQQLVHGDFVQSFKQILDETGVAAASLHLEITESEMMSELDSTVHVIQELRSMGAKIDLDDFGTGYSSLACLHQIPLDIIKLDRSLVSTIDQDDYLLRLAKLVLQLLSESEIKVVAEGIETLGQLAVLQDLGCHLGQGYLFAKPLAADKVLEFIKKLRLSSKFAPRPIAAPSIEIISFNTSIAITSR